MTSLAPDADPSPNTQAILLLTAPLTVGRDRSVVADPLTHGEYKRLVRHLIGLQRQPSDLLDPGAWALIEACAPVVETGRLVALLGRGFQLSQALERWQARAIWVMSRADAAYPRVLKRRLHEDAPAVLYGCGEVALLSQGGLAVVGSRHVDTSLLEATARIGGLVAQAGRVLVSGGAKGIDQAAMAGAADVGGAVVGVLADSLERVAVARANRDRLMAGRLVLVSPFDPAAGFHVGLAMQRNKLVYALADAALVVSSDLGKGGTWAGAVEQLERLARLGRLGGVPVYVRWPVQEAPSAGLAALRDQGAQVWPEPQDVSALQAVLTHADALAQAGLFDQPLDQPLRTAPSIVAGYGPST